jgi:hypothetical protein
MDGRADGARHALCRLRPWSLACGAAVRGAFSPHLSNHDCRLTVATRSWRAVGRLPEGRVGRTWQPWPSTPPLMSSAPAAWTVPETSAARSFPSLLHRLVALPADRPLMASEPAASTISESSVTQLYLSPPEAGVQWVECPRGWAGRTWQPWPSTLPLMSSVFVVLESSGARSFPSLLDRQATLPAARPLMSSAPAAPTVSESSRA